jgi:hypothetical protein
MFYYQVIYLFINFMFIDKKLASYIQRKIRLEIHYLF